MEDHYKDIDGFPGYRVSREGDIQSCWGRGNPKRLTDAWRTLKPVPRRGGYLGVNLHAGGVKVTRYVHHLVLEAFVGQRPPGHICCHNDGDRLNNRADNLRWDTYRANSEDMLRHGTRLMGSRCNAKLVEGEVLEIRRLRSGGVPVRELAARYGVTPQNVANIVHRRSWRHLP
jgi:hypothetical protein